MNDMLENITNYGAGVVALAFVFGLAWYLIQHITPTLLELKTSAEVTTEVIKNNTKVTEAVIEALARVDSHLIDGKNEHQIQQKNYEIHNERTIRVEQGINILLDRSIDK